MKTLTSQPGREGKKVERGRRERGRKERRGSTISVDSVAVGVSLDALVDLAVAADAARGSDVGRDVDGAVVGAVAAVLEGLEVRLAA